jgi:hypothetical protein
VLGDCVCLGGVNGAGGIWGGGWLVASRGSIGVHCAGCRLDAGRGAGSVVLWGERKWWWVEAGDGVWQDLGALGQSADIRDTKDGKANIGTSESIVPCSLTESRVLEDISIFFRVLNGETYAEKIPRCFSLWVFGKGNIRWELEDLAANLLAEAMCA